MSAAERLLERLVAYPSVAGQSNLELVADVAQVLADAGATVREVPGPRPDARNLHAVVGPVDAPGVLLAAHTDVVGIAGQAWTREPFRLTRDGGRLYGRGTADMKGFVAAAVAAVCAAAGRRLRRPLHLALSCDEELGCRGVGTLLDVLAQLPARPCCVIVGEPTELRVAVAHKGKVARRVRVRGRACHSGFAPLGVNAVAYAGRLIAALHEIGQGLEAVADPRFSVPWATLSIGPIAGGEALNVVPDRCCFDFEVRTLPGRPACPALARAVRAAAALEAEMRRVDRDAGIVIEPLAEYPALADEGTERVAAAVAELAGATAGGTVDFGTEAGLYRERLGVPAVVCGPGSMAQGHRPDEFLEVRQLRRAEAMLARLLATLAA